MEYHSYKPKITTSVRERPRRLDRVLRVIECDIRRLTVITKNAVVLMKIFCILIKATVNFLRNIRD